jgi:hypothetical protein
VIDLLADWTTAGPYKNLTWVTITFTAVVILSIIFVIFELWDSFKTFNAVRQAKKNGGLLLLAESSLRRSTGRLIIQLSFLILAAVAIYVSIDLEIRHLYWYRVTFVATFLLSELVLCLLIINDIITRHRLEILINKYYNDRSEE